MDEIQVRVIQMTVAGEAPRIEVAIDASDGVHARIIMSLESWSRMISRPGTNVDAKWHQEGVG